MYRIYLYIYVYILCRCKFSFTCFTSSMLGPLFTCWLPALFQLCWDSDLAPGTIGRESFRSPSPSYPTKNAVDLTQNRVTK